MTAPERDLKVNDSNLKLESAYNGIESISNNLPPGNDDELALERESLT